MKNVFGKSHKIYKHWLCLYSEFFWLVFSLIRTEYGDLLCKEDREEDVFGEIFRQYIGKTDLITGNTSKMTSIFRQCGTSAVLDMIGHIISYQRWTYQEIMEDSAVFLTFAQNNYEWHQSNN